MNIFSRRPRGDGKVKPPRPWPAPPDAHLRRATRKTHVEPGHFLPTVERHVRFVTANSLTGMEEIRFVVAGGKELQPLSTYLHEGIVYVDLGPIQYEETKS